MTTTTASGNKRGKDLMAKEIENGIDTLSDVLDLAMDGAVDADDMQLVREAVQAKLTPLAWRVCAYKAVRSGVTG